MFTKIMHKTITIFTLILFAANAFAFEFYSTNKSHTYNIKQFSEQISKEYKISLKLFTVLVVAKNGQNNSYISQFKELKKLDAESLLLAFVSATTDKEYTHGYHASTSVSKSLLSNNELIVVVYSPEGNEIFKSKTVVTSAKIIEVLNKHNKTLVRDLNFPR